MTYDLKIFFEDGTHKAYRGTKDALLMILSEEEMPFVEVTIIDKDAATKGEQHEISSAIQPNTGS